MQHSLIIILNITDARRDRDSVQLRFLKLKMCVCLVVCCSRVARTYRLLKMFIIDPVLKWKKTHLTYRVNGNNPPWGRHLDEFSEQQATTHDVFALGTFYLFLEAINSMKHCLALTFPQKSLICIHNCALLTIVPSLPLFLFQWLLVGK